MLPVLIELQRLKRLERTGWSLRGMPHGTESVAAHSFGVSIVAMLLADELVRQGASIDVERVLKLALLHDWPEARVGDLPRTAINYFGVAARKHAESEAFAAITDTLNTREQYRALYEEYEVRQTLESRLVKAADIIDLLVQVLALERSGMRGLEEFWEVTAEPDFQLEGTAAGLVGDILASLLEERRSLGL